MTTPNEFDIVTQLSSMLEDDIDDYTAMDIMKMMADELYDRGYSVADLIDVIREV